VCGYVRHTGYIFQWIYSICILGEYLNAETPRGGLPLEKQEFHCWAKTSAMFPRDVEDRNDEVPFNTLPLPPSNPSRPLAPPEFDMGVSKSSLVNFNSSNAPVIR